MSQKKSDEMVEPIPFSEAMSSKEWTTKMKRKLDKLRRDIDSKLSTLEPGKCRELEAHLVKIGELFGAAQEQVEQGVDLAVDDDSSKLDEVTGGDPGSPDREEK